MVKVSAGVRAAVQIFFNECATNPKRHFLQCVVNSWTACLHVASPREKKTLMEPLSSPRGRPVISAMIPNLPPLANPPPFRNAELNINQLMSI